jgi:hypothetical protein
MQRRDISKVLLASAAGTVLPPARGETMVAKTADLPAALLARGEVRIATGQYAVTSKLQTLVPNNIVGDSREDTILLPGGFSDYVLEVGNGKPGPNNGRIARLRFRGAAGNLGCLHMNKLSHMWRLDDLLFSGGPCPALVVDNCWDSNYTSIDILGHYTRGNDPAQTAAVIFTYGSNNIYCRGLRIEGALSGGIYTDGGPIYVVTGKIDDGFGGPQTAAAITVTANGSLVLEDFYIGGNQNQFHIDVAGALKLDKVTLDGGSNRPAAINDRRAWGHINPLSFPTFSSASAGPYIPGLDLGNAEFHRIHPSVNSETPAAVYSKIHPVRQVKDLTVRANGAVQGNTLIVGTTVPGSHNDLYKNSFLVHTATGTHRKILSSFVGGNLVLEGTEPLTLGGDWSIEYCENHDTPIRHENAWLAPGQSLFAVVASPVAISGTSTYITASDDSAYGTTKLQATSAGLVPGHDLTGLFLVDDTTGSAHYIEYGMDARGFIGVIYDRRAELDPSHEFSIVAGHTPKYAASRQTLTRIVASAAVIAPDLSHGSEFEISAPGPAGFTVSNPINTRESCGGLRISFTVSNDSRGAMGEVTWGTAYKLAPWVSPAPGHSRSIDFRYNGKNWVEVARTPADVPN